jgi:energy-coupling factor transport system ATP-binding protein
VFELRTEDLSFAFSGRAPLFQHLSFELHTGEMVVLAGENASGKTTLLRLLAGLLRPTSGRVVLTGESSGDPRGRVGILFQNPDHQMLAATVEEELALGLELRAVDPARIRVKVDSLLARFELQALRESPPEALSGGQKQRVALAAIMAAQPPFLLFDEPDSFLDAPARHELMIALSEVREECGVLWVTPHPRSAPAADRYGYLRDGRIEAVSDEDFTVSVVESVDAGACG